MAGMGFLLGNALIVATATMSAFSMSLQVEAVQLSGVTNFRLVAGKDPHTQRLWLTLLVLFSVALKCFGVMTAYLILLGDTMNEANLDMGMYSESSPISDRRIWILLIFAAICSWNVIRTRLEKSTYTAAASLLLAFGVVLLIVVSYIDQDLLNAPPPTENRTSQLGPLSASAVMARLSFFVFAYTCHQNVFTVYAQLKDNRPEEMRLISMTCVSVCGLLYALVGSIGYSLFGQTLQSDILLNYPLSTGASNAWLPLWGVARLSVALHVAGVIHAQAIPLRQNVEEGIHILGWAYREYKRGNPFSFVDMPPYNIDTSSFRRRLVLTCIFCGASLAISMWVTNLGIVFSLVGSTGSILISVILPALCYLEATKDKTVTLKIRFVKVYVVFGVLLGLVCFLAVLLKASGKI
jgi:amino acid permease